MLSEDTKIFGFNQYQKSDKASFINYADLECLIEKIVVVKIILKMYSFRTKSKLESHKKAWEIFLKRFNAF